jgi:hypothetical protein
MVDMMVKVFDGNEFVDFYSINNDKKSGNSGRALPFESRIQFL